MRFLLCAGLAFALLSPALADMPLRDARPDDPPPATPVATDTSSPVPRLDAAVERDFTGAFDGSRCYELRPLIDADPSDFGPRILPYVLRTICAPAYSREEMAAKEALAAQRKRVQQPAGSYFGETVIHVATRLDAIAYSADEDGAAVGTYYEVAGGGKRLYLVTVLREGDQLQHVVRAALPEFAARSTAAADTEDDPQTRWRKQSLPAMTTVSSIAHSDDVSTEALVGTVLAWYRLGWTQAIDSQGRQLLELAASVESESVARRVLAETLLLGKANAADDARARQLAMEASALHLGDADVTLAAMDLTGTGGPRLTVEQSAAMHRAEQALGPAQAKWKIGVLLLQVRSRLYDRKLGLLLLQAAAETGDARAQDLWGLYCAVGATPERQRACRMDWRRKAAAQGYTTAMIHLATDESNASDPATRQHAHALLEHALADGDGDAALELGLLYYYGRGVPVDKVKAKQWWAQAADWGNGTAQNNLGIALLNAEYGPTDPAEAVRWFHIATLQADINGMTNYARQLERGSGVAADPVYAVEIYRTCVKQAGTAAMLYLARMAYDGRGMQADPAYAIDLLRRAAEAGDVSGMRQYGVALAAGNGAAANPKEGLAWLQRSAEAGDAEAMMDVAVELTRAGPGQDYVASFRWCRRAADLHNAWAMNMLAWDYERGRGTAIDGVEARRWYERSARAHLARGSYNYARVLRDGIGGPVDAPQARAGFAAAIALDSVESKCSLGEMLDNGVGGSVDKPKAQSLMREAADAGNKECLWLLGNALREAALRGEPGDRELALKYLQKAADAGHAQAKAGAAALRLQRADGIAGVVIEARLELEMLAGTGNQAAMLELARQCASGASVARDLDCTRRHYANAAARGNVDSLLPLALLSVAGIDVPASLPAADSWLRQVLLHPGDDAIRARYVLTRLLLRRNETREVFSTLIDGEVGDAAAYLAARHCREHPDCPLDTARREALNLRLSKLAPAMRTALAKAIAGDPFADATDGAYALAMVDRGFADGLSEVLRLDLAAAAAARARQYERAVTEQKRALAALDKDADAVLRAGMQERLALFEQGREWSGFPLP